MARHLPLSLLVAAMTLSFATSTLALGVGQADDFEDGTTQGWGSGGFSPNPPINLSDGGPMGVGDNHLQMTATGVPDAGGHLVARNSLQWTGDYLAAGVRSIRMDLNNTGANPLAMRIAFNGPGGWFGSLVPVPLVTGEGWSSTVFFINSVDLVCVDDLACTSLEATLLGVLELRILSSEVPSFRGDVVDAQVGVDNITGSEAGRPTSLPSMGARALGSLVLAVAWIGARNLRGIVILD
jgi:hypothetical protein